MFLCCFVVFVVISNRVIKIHESLRQRVNLKLKYRNHCKVQNLVHLIGNSVGGFARGVLCAFCPRCARGVRQMCIGRLPIYRLIFSQVVSSISGDSIQYELHMYQ